MCACILARSIQSGNWRSNLSQIAVMDSSAKYTAPVLTEISVSQCNSSHSAVSHV